MPSPIAPSLRHPVFPSTRSGIGPFDARPAGSSNSSLNPVGTPVRIDARPAVPARTNNTDAVEAARTGSSAPNNGLELTLEMPDTETVPLSVELRDVATRWWVPGAIVPDVLQRTGWFPRTFSYSLTPEKVGPTTYRVRLERGWYARLCGAEMQPALGPNTVTVARTTSGGANRANILLMPDRNTGELSSSCSLPAGSVGTEYNPLSCTASVAGARSSSSTVRLEWPR